MGPKKRHFQTGKIANSKVVTFLELPTNQSKKLSKAFYDVDSLALLI